MTTLTSIAEKVLAYAKQIESYNELKGISPTSFRHNTLKDLPDNVKEACDGLINETTTLRALAEGPEDSISHALFSVELEVSRICNPHSYRLAFRDVKG